MCKELLSLRFGEVAPLEEELQQFAASGHEGFPRSAARGWFRSLAGRP